MRSLWILAGVTLGAMIPPSLGPLLVPAGIGVLALSAFARCLRSMLLLLAAAAVARGLVMAGLDAQLECEERVLAVARVTDVPARTASGWRFEALLRHPRQPGRADLRAMVELPGQGPVRPHAGETWRLLLRYQPIAADPAGGVDPLRLAVRDRRQAGARALRSPLNRQLAPAGPSIDRLRERVAARIQRRAMDPSAGALLAALAVGVTGGVTARQWRDFSATGITHLVAISGAHVTFFALLSMALVRGLWNRTCWLQQQVQRERLAGLAGVVLAGAYALLSGFSVPAQRTLLMLAAFVLWRESARASSPCWSLAVAMCAVLALDPLAILGAGFWLSFGAVAAILLLPGSRLGEEGALRSGARVQFAVSIALLPLTVLLFGSFSFAGLLVNAVAIPLFGFVLVPGALLATLAYLLPGWLPRMLGDLLVDCAGTVASWMLPLLGRVAQWEAASWLGAMPATQLALVVLAALACLLPLRPAARIAGAMLVFCGFMGRFPPPAAGTVELAVLGAGTSTSVIVTTASHRLVFGTGEMHGGDGRRFRARVIDYLRREGGPEVQQLVIGRPRAERLRAATVAAARWPGLRIVGDASAQPLPAEFAGCGGSWHWDQVGFELAAPAGGSGCVLRVRAKQASALLTLDVDETGWRALRERGSHDDVVLLPLLAEDTGVHADATPGSARLPRWLLATRQHSALGQRRWRQLQQQAQDSGDQLLDASGGPRMLVQLGGAVRVDLRNLHRWRWGAWADRDTTRHCGDAAARRQ